MACELKKLFGRLASTLPDAHKGAEDGFLFSAKNVVRPRSALKTDQIVIAKRIHAYNSFRVDSLSISASKETYRHLALLILGIVFAEEEKVVELALTNPASHIRRLRLSMLNVPFQNVYTTKPHSFEWIPRQERRHPWTEDRPEPDPYDLPMFELTTHDEMPAGADAEWKKRDTVLGFGNDRANIRLAELLLNASCPSAEGDEYELEGELGFRGVAPGSAEATFWMPGGIGFDLP